MRYVLLSWGGFYAKSGITVQTVSLLPNRIYFGLREQTRLCMQTTLRETLQIVLVEFTISIRVNHADVSRHALGPFLLWPYRFSSWPAVRLRTTDVVTISKSDILPPCSLAPIHLYIMPSSRVRSISLLSLLPTILSFSLLIPFTSTLFQFRVYSRSNYSLTKFKVNIWSI